MYVGTQFDCPRIGDDFFRQLKQLGIDHVCSTPDRPASSWTADHLKRHRERVESFGISLDMIPLGHIGTAPVKGRGGSTNRSFVYAEAEQEPLTAAGRVDADTMWERIACFLERVVPVAEEYGIRIACHPHDPPVPSPQELRGVDRVMGSIAGLRRFVEIAESPFHGLNFCQGTVCEMLDNPGEEIFDVIRWFGERGKIFNVHFRNIRGGFCNFVETFPDEGDVDFYEALKVYKEVGYQYMIMPDHVPKISGPEPDLVAFAFALGYQVALLQAVGHL